MSNIQVERDRRKFDPKRGEIYMADLNPRKGSEQQGVRPVLVLQNNIVNKFFRTTIVASISSSEGAIKAKESPVNVFIGKAGGLKRNSVVKLSQITVVDMEERFKKLIGKLSDIQMEEIDKSMKFVLGVVEKCPTCKNTVEENIIYCKVCKKKLRKKCNKCNLTFNLEWNYCPKCGGEV
ncbi:type II toxin-antitoxin system PemK/MazF family toxin [Clostridioides difficile]